MVKSNIPPALQELIDLVARLRNPESGCPWGLEQTPESLIPYIATKFGFEREKVDDVWDKFSEELGEFKEALQTDDVQHQESELGYLLFTVVNLARWYKLV